MVPTDCSDTQLLFWLSRNQTNAASHPDQDLLNKNMIYGISKYNKAQAGAAEIIVITTSDNKLRPRMIISPPPGQGLESHSLFLSLTQRRRQPGKFCNLTIISPGEKSLERSSPGRVSVPGLL